MTFGEELTVIESVMILDLEKFSPSSRVIQMPPGVLEMAKVNDTIKASITIRFDKSRSKKN